MSEVKPSGIVFSSASVPAVLPFDFLYAHLSSKPYRFTDLPKKARGNGTGLEELTVLRSMAVGKRLAADAAAGGDDGGGSGASAAGAASSSSSVLDEAELLFRASRDAEERVSWIGKYLGAIESFECFLRSEGMLEPRPPTPRVPLPGGGFLSIVADAILAQDDVAKKLVFEWQSALGSGGSGGGFAKLFGLSAEKAATTALLAAALRNAGTAVAAAAAAAASASKKGGAASEDGAGEDSSGAALVNAASLFRRAAGLYDAIAAAGDAAASSASSSASLPPLAELRPSAARALSCLCLADAQALVAAKAKSASVRGSAWAGAAQLYHKFGKESAEDASAAAAGAAADGGGGGGSAAVPPPPLCRGGGGRGRARRRESSGFGS